MIPKELAAASTRPMVLALLAHGEEYGYALIQRVRDASGGAVDWSEGMLYPVLHRLEKEGLIRATWKQAESGRRRKYYRLNASGKRSLERHRAEWLAVHETLNKLWGPTVCFS